MLQSKIEIADLILQSRPNTTQEQALIWATYLVQLNGCHLVSAIGQDIDQEKWLKARTSGIGGSEIASIMGVNKWSSPRQIWMSKVGMFDDKPPTQSEAARWGNVLETSVATEWGLRNNRRWVHIPVILCSDSCPWMFANIDGFTLDEEGNITGILEVKTTSEYNRAVWEEGPLPLHYIYQANWYCGITGLQQFDIICLVGGQKLYSYTLPFDTELFTQQSAAAEKFWKEHVVTGIEPTATEVDLDSLKTVEVEEALPPAVYEDDESERLTTAYVDLREKISKLNAIKDALYAQLFVKLGKHSEFLTKTRVVSLQITNRRSCDMDLLAHKYPEAFAECVSTSQSKSLKIK